ncbi:uncharacterized protein LOC128035458 [Gossypium raimondii]|uniref:uncharacterized protein LOC128035458 n=1 Tax=Gossypium raimondii TaxID=29730 RepID=UPI00227A61CE|nr:uncharacterized protein LOC128035458 [Gossypium raimondii]
MRLFASMKGTSDHSLPLGRTTKIWAFLPLNRCKSETILCRSKTQASAHPTLLHREEGFIGVDVEVRRPAGVYGGSRGFGTEALHACGRNMREEEAWLCCGGGG